MRDRATSKALRNGVIELLAAEPSSQNLDRAQGHYLTTVLRRTLPILLAALLSSGGAGKSAIYELAGLLRTGPTVVVSPLIALEDDQLAHLRDAGLSARYRIGPLLRPSYRCDQQGLYVTSPFPRGG